jgi:stage II sporulation protein D
MANRISLVRRLTLVLLLCVLCLSAQGHAQDAFRFGVFSLFKPSNLIVRPAKDKILLLTISKTSFPIDSELEIRRGSEGMRILANGRSYHAESVLITSRNGGATDFMLAVPGKITRNFRGTLEITQSHRQLQVFVSIERELAVASAVKAEAPPDAPMEALKAQAVVARSFYIASRNRHQDSDFCDTTHCQLLKEPPRSDDPASIATQQTRGITLHYRGEIVAAMFSAGCGGHTRTLADVGIVSSGYPYYSVEDSYCERNARRWRARLTSPEAHALAASHSEHDRLELGRKVGWNVVPGNEYQVKTEGDTVIFEGKGSGHGLGLCQQGASAMARDGATFRDILAHYLPNTTVGE